MMETLRMAVDEIALGNKPDATQTPAQPFWDPHQNMMCLVWNGKKDFRYVEHPRPTITELKDILLRVTATTICGSDLHLWKGVDDCCAGGNERIAYICIHHLQTFMGMRTGDIPGHEFMGVVEEVGADVQKLKPGMRVVVGCMHAFIH